MNYCLFLSFSLYVPNNLYLIILIVSLALSLIEMTRTIHICMYVFVIAREGVNFGINFTSCSENGNEIARGVAKCYFAVIATTSGIYPKISLLLVLSQINTIVSFVKVKISYFQTRFRNE